jgi:hypothetical protein
MYNQFVFSQTKLVQYNCCIVCTQHKQKVKKLFNYSFTHPYFSKALIIYSTVYFRKFDIFDILIFPR